ncbi:hypothetical protein E2C01_009501 [Portunus trituberculatus]|uniref:Uncharacterized protein n=1 Tax=Portunus trituberculatus TaxID=210409 RepID=A0A5B7D5Y1_PORTR|nr:hypothetical protein [Portunus trituberculatus]
MGEDIRDLEQTCRKTISAAVNSDGLPQGRNTNTELLLPSPAAHLQPSPVQALQMHTFPFRLSLVAAELKSLKNGRQVVE